jgi:tetratricopeptide (TPR) repeat protein
MAVLVAAMPPLAAAAAPAAPPSPPRPPTAAPASTASTAGFERLARQAADARDSGRLEEAISLYRKALKLRPSWVEGRWYLGTLLYDLERHEEARDALRRVIGAQPKNGPARALKGLCDFQLHDYDRALTELQAARALGLGGNRELFSVVRYHTAILLNRAEQFERAFDVLRELVLEGNETVSVVEATGISMLRMPLLPSEMPPERRELVLMAGRAGVKVAARRAPGARAAFEELVARYPETPNVHYAYGGLLLIEEPDAALEEFRRELKVSPSHVPAMLQIAFEQIKRGDYPAALPLAREAVELAPTLFPARNALGRALLETGDTPGAIEQLEAGVKLAPDSPEMRFALARAYTRGGRPADAERERAAFLRLDQAVRAAKSGPQAVGGIVEKKRDKPEDKPPQ